MTVTLDIPESDSAKLAAVGIDAETASRYVLSVLLDVARRADEDAREVRAWWDSLSSEEREEERRLTAASKAAADAGQVTSLADAVGRIRQRYHAGRT